MSRTGRPRVKGQSVYVRLAPEVAEELTAYVERAKVGPAPVSKSATINWALRKFLSELPKTL